MPHWLERLTRRAGPPSKDASSTLRDYPPYVAPHTGLPRSWSRPQAEENLAHLVQHRGGRLAVLGDWLRAHGEIDIRPALSGGDAGPLLDQLHAWANTQFAAWHRPALADPGTWLRSTRTGDQVVFSLLFDLSLLLGELIMVRNDGYAWGLDLDPLSERDHMHSWQRPILLLPARPGVPPGMGTDLEKLVVGRFQQPNNPLHRVLNDWKDEVLESASGAKEAAWTRLAAGSA